MTEGMKRLLVSIVDSSRAQIRQLERQIKEINGLLYVANEHDPLASAIDAANKGD